MNEASGVQDDVEAQISRILVEELALPVMPTDTDLVAGGYLDSLSLVDLVFNLEQTFGFEIGLDDLDADNFATIENIAQFVRAHR